MTMEQPKEWLKNVHPCPHCGMSKFTVNGICNMCKTDRKVKPKKVCSKTWNK